MKKLLLALVFSLLCTTTFAATLKGTITDGDTALEEVTVTLGSGNSANSKTSGENGYKFTDITITNGLKISFEHPENPAKYYKTTGQIVMENGKPYIWLVSAGAGKQFSKEEVKLDGDTYTLNAELLPVFKKIISGTVYYEDKNSEEKPLAGVEVSATVVNGGFEVETVTTDSNGEFILMGYLSRKYNLTFHKEGYEDEEEPVNVKDKEMKMSRIVMENPTQAALRQKNLESVTGFECDELMPKYLVGANCVENSDLKGDATDLAVWIQKFGSKITSMIGMLAVVLIVWNAFNIVTAAGDTDQIKKGKDGIKWTVLGLAVTMFAYKVICFFYKKKKTAKNKISDSLFQTNNYFN